MQPWKRNLLLFTSLLSAASCGALRDATGDDDDDGATTATATPTLPPLDPTAGMNAGQPLDDQGNIHDQAARIRETGAGWARVNFRLGPHDSPEDPVWQAKYQAIVDSYVAQDVEVYGLIGGESFTSAGALGSDAWLDDYAIAFVKIIDLFKDRVRVFESFNEPNDFAGGTVAQLPPERFAAVLERLYLETKVNAGHADDPAWQVTLVSGPLFSFDGVDAADYFAAVYAAGRAQGAWDFVCGATGSFPLDGIGYHVYVREDPAATEAEVAAALRANTDAILAASDAGETGCPTAAPSKQLWMSEVGWNAEYTGEAIQARNVGVLFDAYRDDPRMAVFFWFTIDDFPGGPYGLFRLDGTARPSWDAFRLETAAP